MSLYAVCYDIGFGMSPEIEPLKVKLGLGVANRGDVFIER